MTSTANGADSGVANGAVVLFDLDGTVLTFEGASPGPGRTALEQAMRDLHGIEGATAGLRVAGGTDRAIARAMLGKAGLVADDAKTAAILDAYVVRLRTLLLTRRYKPVGDVASVVRKLEAEGVVVGVATGNTRLGASLKLHSAGLGAVFAPERGAYGCEIETRSELVSLAACRCAMGVEARIVVVGDTEQDVAAARSIGASVVGVAINEASRAELHAAGADAIVSECGDALVRAILHKMTNAPAGSPAGAPCVRD